MSGTGGFESGPPSGLLIKVCSPYSTTPPYGLLHARTSRSVVLPGGTPGTTTSPFLAKTSGTDPLRPVVIASEPSVYFKGVVRSLARNKPMKINGPAPVVL